MKYRVLIIDDDEEICEELSEILLDEGYYVETALDGYAGLAFIQQEHFDVILLDLKMPRLNGFQVLQEIKQKKLSEHVVVLTGRPLSSVVQEAMAQNNDEDAILNLADKVINKPFEVSYVLETVKLVAHSATISS